ncbi:Uma2 family endonuclease [Pseudonocardia adelaidensis]|uniref:Uma2 family endonuclease n=1 Tax=Pseudonocardia adelaidensis TaxID=648754 RepID=A0ABP9NHR2_9PSEU
MDTQSLFDHEGPWTEAAYLALKHDGRVEVVDGTLLIGPGPHPRRLRAIERLREAVAAALPDGLVVRGPVPLRLGPDCVLVPDLVVTAAPSADDAGGADGGGAEQAGEEAGAGGAAENADTAVLETTVLEAAVLDAAAALMVIEVVGCDHGATDRSFKLQLYSRSRIPYSVLVDHDGPFAVADMIIGGRYHEYARAGGEETLLIEEPFRLELDLAEITAPEPGPPARPAEASAESPAEAAPTQAFPVIPTEGPGVKA